MCFFAKTWLVTHVTQCDMCDQAQLRPTQRFRASSDGLGRIVVIICHRSFLHREMTYPALPPAWGGHMPLSDEESLLCEEEQEDEFDLTEVVIHQADVCGDHSFGWLQGLTG